MLNITFVDHKTQKQNEKVQIGEKVKSTADSVVVLVAEGGKLLATAAEFNKAANGAIKTAIETSRFEGKKGDTLSILAPANIPFSRLTLLGIGKEKELDALKAQIAGGKLVAHLKNSGAKKIQLIVDNVASKEAFDVAANIAFGSQLRFYSFDKYHTTKKPEEKPTLTAIEFEVEDSKKVAKHYEVFEKTLFGTFLTRDVVSEPANIIYPESLAARCKELTSLGLEVEILDVAQMQKLGMGSLLGVGQGSSHDSRLVVLKWNGGKKSEAPLAFVGKGVTFDTGGISIKPANGMEEMKYDMAGAGTVIGLLATLAGRKAKINAVGVVGLVENMPDGNAQRPGDVVTSMSGQTIEVLNTDAEGRLVLADALWYTQEKFNPAFIIDLATLTGAIVVALGTSRAGLFSNNDKLSEQLFDAGKKVGEEVWRLPLAEVYDKQINSDIADMQNIGKDREAGSITAAQFLKRFIKDDKTPWVHLDIAGVAWAHKDIDLVAKGASAFGIRLLNQLVIDYYE